MQHASIMCRCDIVTELTGALVRGMCIVPTSYDDWFGPHFLVNRTISRSKEKMCNEDTTETIVPRSRIFGESAAPDLTNVPDVVGVIEMHAWKAAEAFCM